MEDHNFSATVNVNAPPAKVLKKIAEVDHWWAKDFTGRAQALNDRFTIRFKDTFVDFEISEFIPDSKVAWHVTDCYLPFQDNRTEWVDTTVLFEVSEQIDRTETRFTHIGRRRKSIALSNAAEGGQDLYWVVFQNGLMKIKGIRNKIP